MVQSVSFRAFSGGFGLSEDYLLLRHFLSQLREPIFTFGRLDWMIFHRPYLDEQHLDRIGLWFSQGQLVGTALFDTTLDDVFPVVRPGFEALLPEMLSYALAHMIRQDAPDFRLLVPDGNDALRRAALDAGLVPSEDRETVLRLELSPPPQPAPLPTGFRFVSMADQKDYRSYLHCLFRGFGHEEAGESFSFSADDEALCRQTFEQSLADPALKVSAMSPDGVYRAHCGVWTDAEAGFALVEPVAADPAMRRLGLGRAVVTEALRRAAARGAGYALVNSDLPFYHAIGFRPFTGGCFYVHK